MEKKGSPNCNLELSLHSPATPGDDHSRREQEQPLTIFYNGRYRVYDDVTEMLARAIIMMLASSSSQETASMADDKSVTSPGDEQPQRRAASPETPPAVGLSMKRSLQRFLQKRKGRAQAAAVAPYSRAVHNKELQFQINYGFQILAP
ncbi:unnamed protein product [Linum trigynum]|uniref:Protein TIFY n=1 Tax=Linum trigynum TaxID=586398 RepID=A0AAV2G5M7_9ROSI